MGSSLRKFLSWHRKSSLEEKVNAQGICMVIAHFPPKVGGTEKQAKILAQHLLAKGYKVLIATMRLPGEKAYEGLDGMEINRILSCAYSLGYC